MGLRPPRGVYVHDVLNDQPAQQAGIVAGDIILSFDGQRITTPFELQSQVAITPAGEKGPGRAAPQAVQARIATHRGHDAQTSIAAMQGFLRMAGTRLRCGILRCFVTA